MSVQETMRKCRGKLAGGQTGAKTSVTSMLGGHWLDPGQKSLKWASVRYPMLWKQSVSGLGHYSSLYLGPGRSFLGFNFDLIPRSALAEDFFFAMSTVLTPYASSHSRS